MKRLPLFIGLSLAVNASLLAYLARAPRTVPDRPGPAAAIEASINDTPTEGSAALAELDLPEWASLAPDELLALLRTNGFPPHIQRAVISAHVYQAFLPRLLDVVRQHPEKPYWRELSAPGSDPDLMAAQRPLWDEQRALIRQLLGPESETRDEFSVAMMRSRFGDLAPEKVEAVQKVLSDYAELRSQHSAQTTGVLLAEDRERQALLERAEREDLAAILTPEELRAYELRSGRTAGRLRSDLILFDPTEAEFGAIHDARRAAEETFGNGNPKEVHAAVLAGLKDEIDPARWPLLEQSLDPAYGAINRIVARLQLPPTTAREVVELQRDVSTRLTAMTRDSNLSDAERSAQLEALNRETTQRLTSLIGEDGLSVYRDLGGAWLRRLDPPQAPPAAPSR